MKLSFRTVGLLALAAPTIAASLSLAPAKRKWTRRSSRALTRRRPPSTSASVRAPPAPGRLLPPVDDRGRLRLAHRCRTGRDPRHHGRRHVLNTWFDSDDARLCKASFSGNANLSRYNLLPGQCVIIRVGDILLDSGASPTAPIGSRAAWPTSSAPSRTRAAREPQRLLGQPDVPDRRLRRHRCDPSVRSQGYWKTHELDTEALVPVSITIGCQNYTAAQLDAILGQTPAGGNASSASRNQVIATGLNILNGAGARTSPPPRRYLAAAEALMCTTAAVRDRRRHPVRTRAPARSRWLSTRKSARSSANDPTDCAHRRVRAVTKQAPAPAGACSLFSSDRTRLARVLHAQSSAEHERSGDDGRTERAAALALSRLLTSLSQRRAAAADPRAARSRSERE
jgi:hypothetical protein